MKTKIGLPLGLALVMFIGVFTAMLALGVMAPAGVQGSSHLPSVTASSEEFGADNVEYEIKFATDAILTSASSIVLTFSGAFDVSGVVTTPLATDVAVTAMPSGGVAAAVAHSAPSFTSPALTIPIGGDVAVGSEITVTVMGTLGIGNGDGPITQAEIDAPDHGTHTVTVTTLVPVQTATNAPTFNIPTSSWPVQDFTVTNSKQDAGSVVGYRFTFVTASNLIANQDNITVHFDKDFGKLDSLSMSHIRVSASHTTQALTEGDPVKSTGAFNPISDADTTDLKSETHHLSDKDALGNMEYEFLTPDMNGDSDGAPGIAAGSTVNVLISPGAGITNPTENGSKGPLGVFTDKQTTLVYANVEVDLGVSLSSYASNRGKFLTVLGTGFKNGTTATVYLTNSLGTEELFDVLVDSNDTFSAEFAVRVPPFVAGTQNFIYAVDGKTDPNTSDQLGFEVEGLATISRPAAAVGEEVDVTLTDWPSGDTVASAVDALGNVLDSSIAIASVPQRIVGSGLTVTETVSDGTLNFRVEINPNTPSGTQQFKVTSSNENDTIPITISGADLGAMPETVVPHQVINLTGEGYTGQGTIGETNDGSSVKIGNSDAYLLARSQNFNNGQPVTVDSGGGWAASLVVPITTATTTPGTHTLEIQDSGNRSGSIVITIPPRTISIEPVAARPGEWVTLTGSGFPSDNSRSKAQTTPSVAVLYDGDDVGTARPNSDGNFSLRFVVPRDAVIPSTNPVSAEYTIPNSQTVRRAYTTHEVPGARITLSAEEGMPGDTITVTGDGFTSFTSVDYVKIGGIEVTPAPRPATDREGEFSGTILVPDLAPGTNSVEISVGRGTATATTASANFRIGEPIDDTMMPGMMPNEASTPADAFAEVIAEANLITVYHFDPATQSEVPNRGWTLYDARPLFMGGNNLDMINPGGFYFLQVKENQMGVEIGGRTMDLYAGLNPIQW